MITNQRKTKKNSTTVVVKLGTSVLTSGTLALDRAHMVELVRQCTELKKQGHVVVIVSSGSIAAGREHLGYPKLPNVISSKQLLAAVGQSQLIQIWESLFAIYGLKIGQVLLTQSDLDDRERFLNARDTIHALIDNNIIPVVNENDAVATNEIKVGDNDNLSALVSILCGADKLLLLTDQIGLFSSDPRKDPNAQLIKEVKTIDDTLRKTAGDSSTKLGTGGMVTKLHAADIACRSGIEVIIASGSTRDVIIDSLSGKPQGTRFLPSEEALEMESHKRVLLSNPVVSGEILVNDEVVNALIRKESGLLAESVVEVKGEFNRGGIIRVSNLAGRSVALGIASYSSKDLLNIVGRHSREITSVLGYNYGSELINQDDFILI
ncbi:glutamate 5-kinase [Candidatus Photodesmus blepharus]|uniref:glutamate 5-kinase n=1 Tax=Candidatus Photodesmus blepharonis TaxID=1179155 RepID=UPI0005593684|nr:glutamate 5-kinase [Candidatus Photodesmus blepharus]